MCHGDRSGIRDSVHPWQLRPHRFDDRMNGPAWRPVKPRRFAGQMPPACSCSTATTRVGQIRLPPSPSKCRRRQQVLSSKEPAKPLLLRYMRIPLSAVRNRRPMDAKARLLSRRDSRDRGGGGSQVKNPLSRCYYGICGFHFRQCGIAGRWTQKPVYCRDETPATAGVEALMKGPLSSGGCFAVYSMFRSPPEERFGVWCCQVGTRWHRSRLEARTQLSSKEPAKPLLLRYMRIPLSAVRNRRPMDAKARLLS